MRWSMWSRNMMIAFWLPGRRTEKECAILLLAAEETELQKMGGQLSNARHAKLSPSFDEAQIVELRFIAADLIGVAR